MLEKEMEKSRLLPNIYHWKKGNDKISQLDVLVVLGSLFELVLVLFNNPSSNYRKTSDKQNYFPF